MSILLPKRFDATLAKGVDHAIYDENGNYFGTYRTSLFDRHSKQLQVAIQRYEREQKAKDAKAGKNAPKKRDPDANLRAFVEICFHGWSDVPTSDGSEVKFTKEAALALLTYKAELGVDGETQDDVDAVQSTYDWLCEEILRRSADVSNYQADPIVEAEEHAKN